MKTLPLKLANLSEVTEVLRTFESYVSSPSPSTIDKSTPLKELGSILGALNDEGELVEISAEGKTIFLELEKGANLKQIKAKCIKVLAQPGKL